MLRGGKVLGIAVESIVEHYVYDCVH
jgi:hypothetical protein